MFLAASLALLTWLQVHTAAQAGVKISQLHYTRIEGSTPIEVESYIRRVSKKKKRTKYKQFSIS